MVENAGFYTEIQKFRTPALAGVAVVSCLNLTPAFPKSQEHEHERLACFRYVLLPEFAGQ